MNLLLLCAGAAAFNLQRANKKRIAMAASVLYTSGPRSGAKAGYAIVLRIWEAGANLEPRHSEFR